MRLDAFPCISWRQRQGRCWCWRRTDVWRYKRLGRRVVRQFSPTRACKRADTRQLGSICSRSCQLPHGVLASGTRSADTAARALACMMDCWRRMTCRSRHPPTYSLSRGTLDTSGCPASRIRCTAQRRLRTSLVFSCAGISRVLRMQASVSAAAIRRSFMEKAPLPAASRGLPRAPHIVCQSRPPRQSDTGSHHQTHAHDTDCTSMPTTIEPTAGARCGWSCVFRMAWVALPLCPALWAGRRSVHEESCPFPMRTMLVSTTRGMLANMDDRKRILNPGVGPAAVFCAAR